MKDLIRKRQTKHHMFHLFLLLLRSITLLYNIPKTNKKRILNIQKLLRNLKGNLTTKHDKFLLDSRNGSHALWVCLLFENKIIVKNKRK